MATAAEDNVLQVWRPSATLYGGEEAEIALE
jgi:histone-binding protein RBBP4